MVSNNKKIFIILHNIRSRFNVGSVFRTADGAGVSKIYLCGITPTPPHSRISKVALGAEDFVPWEYCAHTWRLIEKLKKQNIQVVAVEQSKTSVPYSQFKTDQPVAIVMGSETKGLSPAILKRCNSCLEIPMHGKKESLNVATACGIITFSLNES